MWLFVNILQNSVTTPRFIFSGKRLPDENNQECPTYFQLKREAK